MMCFFKGFREATGGSPLHPPPLRLLPATTATTTSATCNTFLLHTTTDLKLLQHIATRHFQIRKLRTTRNHVKQLLLTPVNDSFTIEPTTSDYGYEIELPQT